jgi:hypothetical protein
MDFALTVYMFIQKIQVVIMSNAYNVKQSFVTNVYKILLI